LHPVVPGSAARSRVEDQTSAQCRGGAPKGERAPRCRPAIRDGQAVRARAARQRVCANGVNLSAAMRTPRQRLSALRLPSFGRPFVEIACKTRMRSHRENEIACSPLPACGERSSEARVTGPLSESERSNLSPAERPPHPDLLPARGEKESRACWRTKCFIAWHERCGPRPFHHPSLATRASGGPPPPLSWGRIEHHRVFSKISRPISMRRISLVPAPIS